MSRPVIKKHAQAKMQVKNVDPVAVVAPVPVVEPVTPVVPATQATPVTPAAEPKVETPKVAKVKTEDEKRRDSIIIAPSRVNFVFNCAALNECVAQEKSKYKLSDSDLQKKAELTEKLSKTVTRDAEGKETVVDAAAHELLKGELAPITAKELELKTLYGLISHARLRVKTEVKNVIASILTVAMEQFAHFSLSFAKVHKMRTVSGESLQSDEVNKVPLVKLFKSLPSWGVFEEVQVAEHEQPEEVGSRKDFLLYIKNVFNKFTRDAVKYAEFYEMKLSASVKAYLSKLSVEFVEYLHKNIVMYAEHNNQKTIGQSVVMYLVKTLLCQNVTPTETLVESTVTSKSKDGTTKSRKLYTRKTLWDCPEYNNLIAHIDYFSSRENIVLEEPPKMFCEAAAAPAKVMVVPDAEVKVPKKRVPRKKTPEPVAPASV